jgi:hypothetical protein
MVKMEYINNTIPIDADDKVKSQVGRIMTTLSDNTVDLQKLKDEIRSLLEHLSSDEGRTDKNCKAVDSYFMNNDLWAEKELPDELHDIFADMAGALHDTVSSPEIANNFESTPEQLLERLKKVRIEQQL